MSTNKMRAALLAGASALAISVAMSAPVKAFDVVNWEFNATVNKFVTENIVLTTNLFPTGLVMLENVQVHVGDLDATSEVSGITNNQAATGGSGQQEVTFDLGTLGLTSERAGGDHTATATHTFDQTQDGFQSLSETNPRTLVFNTDGGNWVNAQHTDLGTVTFLIDVEVEAEGSYDALTELPEVVSAATAVANNSTVNSDYAVNMHEGQFAFGDFNSDLSFEDAYVAAMAIDAVTPTGNSHTDMLLGAVVLGQLGLIEKGTVSASSNVFDIENATVDSSATAVANNKSITIEPAAAGDGALIADVTQFAYMDVSAISMVSDVSLNNYTNLGVLDRPIVSSVATAVGNNLSINVGAPSGE